MKDSTLTGPWKWFWFGLGAVSISFHLSLVFSGMTPNMISRPIHLALAAPWTLIFVAKTPRAQWIGGFLSAMVIACCGYIVLNQERLSDQYGALQGNLQLVIAVTLLLVVLEMARRSISWPLPLVALLALLYGLLGRYIPGEFGYPGLPIRSFLGTLTIAEGGLWGQLTGVSVSIVSIFVIMGAVLNAGEAGQGFMNLATSVAGRLKGGAAKVSVLSSALFGSISGSASANVASTGAITLPAMVKLGYPRSLAGAVEAVASSGGQIMPPLMGAGAFVMVELTGVPYNDIMGAALLPAILYFMTVWAGINAFALRYDLKGVAQENLPSRRVVFTTAMFFIVPFVILLERMFIGGYTPQYAACVAILAAFLLLFVDVGFSFSLSRSLQRLQLVAINSGKQISTIAAIIICASIVIGVLGQTGLGVKITSLILSGAGHSLWPALLLTGIACMVLGMEVPTTAAYVICVSVAGPALQELGVAPLIAHLFVFWFALLSTITPPVCGAVFIAAGMVDENWLKIAGSAMALGLGLYLIPLGMVANPPLVQLFAAPLPALIVFVKMGVSLVALSFGIIAPKPVIIRIVLIAVGLVGIFI
ncbi:TRAP transporter, 4TM/12TM fusion protein [Desulfuromusa kysingii]|uniref:TRAP transporter, 4TM/12TM fusion protein n=1 Tax=Desulfuromusa kysingii TaxID=37625 RepID=A0A1H3XPI6_9BACT|nr:TRAP transporter fused permease subunit [Desulfuromusa kysingii]SEA00821.1 TRAP transporter, 4TM/12TM fusion protein [Desulfuromusa kysingii]